MWAVVMGADGTGKNVVADILVKRSFTKIEHELSKIDDFNVFNELDYMTKRLSEQLEAQTVMFKQDVFTIRSAWDTFAVMLPTSDHLMRTVPAEMRACNIVYKNICSDEQLTPPHCIIYCKMTKRDIQNRILLKGKQPNDDEISKQIELYDEFLSKVRIPIIELDMIRDPISIRDELNFSIDSMKATSLSSQTIWKRNLFF